jgi:uncharacterized protein
MKYLLLLAIVFAAFLMWRNNRAQSRGKQSSPGSNSTPGQPQDMIACALCDLHVPRTDALPGPGGKLYCSAEHRIRAQS